MSIVHIEFKHFDDIIRKRTELLPYVSAIGLADTAVYNYLKDGGLFAKKQQRSIFYFFQGLNTNPQNLSIFLRDQHQKQTKSSKQKIVKGQFIIYDIFKKMDCVIQINIPGNFQIYKIHNNKKQLISNTQMEMMYVSSVLRSIYNKNIAWGRSYCLFKSKNMLAQFLDFFDIFIRIVQSNDFFISDDFQNVSEIKGSHAMSILFSFIEERHIVHHVIDYLENYIKKKGGILQIYPKLAIFLAQLYNQQEKYAKSLSIIGTMLEKYVQDPFLLYYQSKYMLKLVNFNQALVIVHSIIQYNQYQVWLLTAQIHIQLKNYSDALVCLNHAAKGSGKISKSYPKRLIDSVYAQFQKIGKKKTVSSGDDIKNRIKIVSVSQNPLSLSGSVQQKFKCMIESEYWKLNEGQKKIFNLIRKIKSRIQSKKFHELLAITFQENLKEFVPVIFKKGMTDSQFVQLKASNQESIIKPHRKLDDEEEQVPNFLRDQSVEVSIQEVVKNNRNLSIIPEIESVIENSQFEQKQKESHSSKTIHTKKQMNQGFYKLLTIMLKQNEFDKAQHEENYAKILPVYNKLRTVSKYNNYYTQKMFNIMIKTGNFKSVVVLIAETLDLLEQSGVKKIEFLPYWMEKHVYAVIEEKGLKFLNQLLEKLNFYDEALLDTIQMSKSWKIKGCTF